LPKELITLNAGDPDAEAPQCAINEALLGIIEGGINTHYPHYTSYPTEFQKAVVDYYKNFTGVEYETKNILPAAGSSAALYTALATVLKEGDEVMLFTPYYAGHKSILDGMGVKMNLVPLHSESNYHLDTNELFEHVTPKTKAVLVCNPSNPTGTVFKSNELKAIGDLAVDKDMAIFADEIYLHFVYDQNKFLSIAGLSDSYKDRTLGIMSFSKSFSMTGWRLGYDIVPEKYLEKATLVTSLTAPRPATFVFRAGISCLRSDFTYVETRRTEYEKRRNYFTKAVNDMGWPCHRFEGAFYAWFDMRETGLSSEGFLSGLKKSQNLVLSSGTGFGADGFIRVPLVKPVPVLKEVVNRLKEYKKTL
jgi:aspartate/methionine/tyrosine aminotransferase